MRAMHLLVVALAAVACAFSGALAFADARTDAWRQDIEVARSDFLARDRSFTRQTLASADALLRKLSEEAAGLGDAEIVAGLAQAAALAGNAHTRAYILRNRGVWRRYPIRIWRFDGRWRVVAARPGHEELLGAEIVRIGEIAPGRAEQRVRRLFAGNDGWSGYMAGYSLTSPDALMGVGLLDNADAVFGFAKSGRRWRVRLAPEAHVRRDAPEENWWFLSPAHPATSGWAHVLHGQPKVAPVLAGAGANYRFIRCEGGVAYLQMNRAANAPGAETLDAFGRRVLAALREDPPARLLVDLRYNTGGDLSLGWRFFKALAELPVAQTPGATSVLAGSTTFSAGITHLAQMRTLSAARQVGAPPGDALEFWSEGGNVRLPNSGINMHYADGAHTYASAASRIPRDLVHLDLDVPSIAPDIVVDWSWEAYLAGRDPYAEAALGMALTCPD